MYVSAADNDYAGVTGHLPRHALAVPPGGIAKLHFGAFGGSAVGGTLDLYSMQIRASAFEGESVFVTDLLADLLALTGLATLDGLRDQLLCNDVNCTNVFTTGVDASGAISCAALTAPDRRRSHADVHGGRVRQLAEHHRRGPAWAC